MLCVYGKPPAGQLLRILTSSKLVLNPKPMPSLRRRQKANARSGSRRGILAARLTFRLILQVDDPAVYGNCGCLRAIVRAQFTENTLHVIHHGVLRDAECVSNLFVAESLGDQP